MTDQLREIESRLRRELGQLNLDARDKSTDLHAALAEAVHQYCESAKQSGSAPETVIRQLKEIIADHYRSTLVRPGLLAQDLVWHAVRRCIHAYYRSDHERTRSQ